MFSIGGGTTVVDLFSNGVGFGPGRTRYSASRVATLQDDLDYVTEPAFCVNAEPSTWAMMILGFAGLGFAGYRKSRKAAALAA